MDGVGGVLGGLVEFGDQLAPDRFHIIAADLRDRAVAAVGEAKRHRTRRVALRRADPAIILHRPEHELAPRECFAFETRAAVFLGCLGQDREKGPFVERELVDILVEIGAARRLHPAAAAAGGGFVWEIGRAWWWDRGWEYG